MKYKKYTNKGKIERNRGIEINLEFHFENIVIMATIITIIIVTYFLTYRIAVVLHMKSSS